MEGVGGEEGEAQGGVEGGREEETEGGTQEEQQQISYDYNELRSRPEVVDISPDIHLDLQYPSL